jgi:hypothetical protein
MSSAQQDENDSDYFLWLWVHCAPWEFSTVLNFALVLKGSEQLSVASTIDLYLWSTWVISRVGYLTIMFYHGFPQSFLVNAGYLVISLMCFLSNIVLIVLANCLPRMIGKSKVVHKNTFLLKSVRKQHIKIEVITYLCLIMNAVKH